MSPRTVPEARTRNRPGIPAATRTLLYALAVLLSLPFSVPGYAAAQEVDWERPIASGVRHILGIHYSRDLRETFSMTHCSPDTGDRCFGGDHEDRKCRGSYECRPDFIVEAFLNDMKKEAADHPDDAHTISQAVYAFARLERHLSAIEIAHSCETAEWWCDLVLGMALQRAGREDQAEARFRSGLRRADPELVCRLTDVAELLDDFDRRVYDQLNCAQRMEFAETFWWISDPMLSKLGNDRWAEHINRRFELLLHTRLVEVTHTDIEGARGASTNLHRDYHEARVVRRGFEDSWSIAGGIFKTWTSLEAARYRFTPAASISWGFDSLRYEINATEETEGYTPTDYGPFWDLPAQFARFLDRNSAVVAAAAQLSDAPLDPSAARFFASPGPRGFQRVLDPVEGETRPVFTTEVPSVPLLMGIEAIDERGTVARARLGLMPLVEGIVTVSDPLLIDPQDGELPGNRDEAVPVMLGKTTIEPSDEMAVFWEVYGFTPGSPMEVSVSIVGETKGLLTRIVRALGVRSRAPASVVTWSERATGRTHPMAIAIDIGALEDGNYDLTIEVRDTYGERGTGVRRFEVDRR